MREVEGLTMNVDDFYPRMDDSIGECVVHRWVGTQLHAPADFTAVFIRQD
jgi:hypothetical protein